MAASSFPLSNFNSSNSPCAACKCLRRKCMPGCIFAPYFPPEEPYKFASVHKIFGASNVSKLLNELLPQHREDAVNSIAYEAEARVRDPVYGCVGTISVLQNQVERLQRELDAANAELLRYACRAIIPMGLPIAPAISAQPIMAYNVDDVRQECRSPPVFYPQGSIMATPATWTANGSVASGENNNCSGNFILMDQSGDGRE